MNLEVEKTTERPLKILMSSKFFYPDRGGIEMISWILAEEFTALGHQVTVITESPSESVDLFPFTILRRPSSWQLLQAVRRCDVYLQNHLHFRRAWPLIVIRRPWILGVHVWISGTGWKGFIRHSLMRFARCVSCSGAIAAHLRTTSTVIHSPYDDGTFRRIPSVRRHRDLIMIARLGPDKGLEVLLSALQLLKADGLRPKLMVVGKGSQAYLEKVNQHCSDLGILDQVELVGVIPGEELAILLNEHKVLVAPALWREPFGVVALEGIACGCVVVGSEGGGLAEAIGPCGVTFPNGDAGALAATLSRILRSPETWPDYIEHATTHLASHTRAAVAREYLKVIKSSLRSTPATGSISHGPSPNASAPGVPQG